jgi:hypothetical protein
VQYVLYEASVQLRWSSISKTSPSNRISAQTPGAASWAMARISTNGCRGAIRSGNTASSTPPPGCSTRQRAPAHSRGGWSTQKPIRFRRNVDRAAPSMLKVIVPSASPSIAPRQPKSISPWTFSTSYVTRNESEPAAILTFEKAGGTVPQLRSRTAM